MLGRHERIEEIAQEHADRLGKTVYYYMKSSGGSSSGPVKPGQNRGKRKGHVSDLSPEQSDIVTA